MRMAILPAGRGRCDEARLVAVVCHCLAFTLGAVDLWRYGNHLCWSGIGVWDRVGEFLVEGCELKNEYDVIRMGLPISRIVDGKITRLGDFNEKTLGRMDVIVRLAAKREKFTAAGNVNGLKRLAAEYRKLGAVRIANDITRYIGEM